eukprot:1375145-Amphidinium_carterae.1
MQQAPSAFTAIDSASAPLASKMGMPLIKPACPHQQRLTHASSPRRARNRYPETKCMAHPSPHIMTLMTP